MNSNRALTCIGVLILMIVLQTTLDLDPILSLLIMALAYFILWEYLDKKEELLTRKENIELQEKIKSSSKDAHLKNKQLLTIVSNIPFPLVLLDQDGNVVMSNNSEEIAQETTFENMTYLKNTFVLPVQEFIKDAFIMEKEMDKILRINDVEYQSISVPVMAKQRYRGSLFLFQDVSKTLEGEKMQKRFIADASHELKTPISIIKGMIEILNREDFDDGETQKEFLNQIECEINRLDLLVKDLLQLSRLSITNVILKKENTDMIALIDKACKSMQKQAKEKNIQFHYDYQYKSLINCDAMKMTQVVLNLLSNAINYSDGGCITIQTKKDYNFFVMRIMDQGHGIAQEDMEKIFDRFYRVDDDRSRKSGGSGLGLAIVKSVVEAHGGKISVDSIRYQGTTFTIRIPI